MGRIQLDEDESRVVVVTPVARGVGMPLALVVVWMALTYYGARHFALVHRFDRPLFALVAVPGLAVLATRSWRWRSHKVHVTSKKIVVEGGVLHHFRSAIDLHDVLATRVERRWSERLQRRGCIVLDTPAGEVLVGPLRHPGALCRLIDAQRAARRDEQWPTESMGALEEDPGSEPSRSPRRRRARRE